jgi:PAS domain S-box-containing protein
MDEGIKCLYVDDEPDLLEITRLFLEQAGNFQVVTASSAQEALASSRIPTYDAIISDYQMPDMDGIAFLKEVRHRYGDIPFILFTGRGREEIVIEAINNGADLYLQKGGDPASQFAELAHKIRQTVLRKRAERSRIKAELELRESNELLRLFIRHAPAALAMFDREMRYISASNRWMADYHLGDRDIVGCSHHEIFPEISEEIKDIHRRSLAGEILSATEDRFERKDGSVQWLAWEVRPWYTAMHEIGGIIIFSEDITREKNAEEAIRKSEAKYRSFVETSPDMIWEIDMQGKFLYVSPQAMRILGYAAEELIGKSVIDLMPEEAKSLGIREMKRLASQDEPFPPFEVPARHHDGHTVIFEIRPSLAGTNGTREGFRGVAVDITERKHTENALRESEEKYRSLVEKCADTTSQVNRGD